MSVGRQLKLARVGKDIKAKDLAKAVGIAPKYLSEIEHDKAPGLSVDVFGRLCRALGAAPNLILEWDQNDAS